MELKQPTSFSLLDYNLRFMVLSYLIDEKSVKESFKNLVNFGRTNKSNWLLVSRAAPEYPNLLEVVIDRCSFKSFLDEAIALENEVVDGQRQTKIVWCPLIKNLSKQLYENDPAVFFTKVVLVPELHTCIKEEDEAAKSSADERRAKVNALTAVLYEKMHDDKGKPIGCFLPSPREDIEKCLAALETTCGKPTCFIGNISCKTAGGIAYAYSQRLGSSNPLVLDLENSKYCTLLVNTAAIFGFSNIIEHICNQKGIETLLKYKGTLMKAILFGQVDVVKQLVEKGMDVNEIRTINKSNITPLMMACTTGNEEIVRYLLNHNAEKNFTTSTGRSPFIHAVVQGNFTVGKILLAAGVDINAKAKGVGPRGNAEGSPLLYFLSRQQTDLPADKIKILEFLVENNADLNAEDNYGGVGLVHATMIGEMAPVKFLLDHGCGSMGPLFRGRNFWVALYGFAQRSNKTDILEHIRSREDFKTWLAANPRALDNL
jgi:hypothetical protein